MANTTSLETGPNGAPNVSSPSNIASLGEPANATVFKFLELPPEIRNMIYKLLLITPESIWIRSPRKKRQRKRHFGSILRVNKQINSEAKTIFWGTNKIVFGNGIWGSTSSPNVHALQHFIARVPKDCIRLIRSLEVEVHCYMFWTCGYHYANYGTLKIQRVLSKHFTGLQSLTISTIEATSIYSCQNLEYSRHSLSRLSKHCARCQSPRKALQSLASLPSLETVIFKVEKHGQVADLAQTLMGEQLEIMDKLKIVRTKGHRIFKVVKT